MRRLLIHPDARVDLLEIWHYLAQESSIEAANRVSERIESEIRELLIMPGKGHVRSDVSHEGLRFWRVYSWIVGYKFDEETLTVVRVVHGHRDFRKLFPPEH